MEIFIHGINQFDTHLYFIDYEVLYEVWSMIMKNLYHSRDINSFLLHTGRNMTTDTIECHHPENDIINPLTAGESNSYQNEYG